MKDAYPRLRTLPHEWLVDPADQPEYLELPGAVLDETTDLGSMLCDAQVAKGLGDTVAIIHHESGRQLTFADLAERSDRVAAGLYALGVRPGDRVALRGPNCPEFLVAAIATWKLGAVVTLIPPLVRSAEVRHFLDDTRPKVLVLMQAEADDVRAVLAAAVGLSVVAAEDAAAATGPVFAGSVLDCPAPRPKIDTDLDRVAIVWHTGGTTGRPKGCYHTQRRFILGGLSLGQAVAAAPGQRWAAAAPMGHALGFIHSTNFTLLNGVTLVVVSGFGQPAALLAAIAGWQVTQFTAIAATWGSMLELLESGQAPEPAALSRGFAMWQSSSATETASGWRRRGVELLNNFGSTSFATWVLVPPLDRPVPPAWLGAAAPGYEVIAVDPDSRSELRPAPAGEPGRMAVRGPTGLTYWRLPDKQHADVRLGYTLQDDLIRFGSAETGDLVEYLGRTDFLISSAGNKIAPVEVETVLAGHPAVREVVVIGLPDPLRQEIVAAFVVLHRPADASETLRRELQELVKAKLAPYKYPRRLDFIAAVPRDNVGKVQSMILKKQVLAGQLGEDR
jgi:2-aminobenzoate-CoA ligase